jgi:class 3 adenylate cyclase
MTELPSGMVTFVFTDLEGSTRLWEDHPDEMGGALARHDAILREAIESHGGVVIKSTGDGGYAVFGAAPTAVAASVAAARALAGEKWGATGPLRARIGIHTGEAEARDGDYFGTTLNRAARLMAAAHGGQIVLSQLSAELVRDTLPDGLALLDLGEHRFAGLARTDRVYELAIAGLPSLFPPLQSLGAFPGLPALPEPSFARSREHLAGRGVELERLLEVLARADSGDRQVVVIGGDSGIGKTRLAGELARRARADGAVVLYGRCDEEPPCSYQPFVEALRPYIAACSPWTLRECLHGMEQDLARVFPELLGRIPQMLAPSPSDPETARYRLFEAFVTLFSAIAATQTTVLVLDDVECADKPTLRLLRHLERATADARLLVLVCYRDVQVPANDPLSDHLADLRQESFATRMSLEGLDAEESGQLLRDRARRDVPPALVAALHAATGGNPFFLEELVRHLIEDDLWHMVVDRDVRHIDLEALKLPASVREVVGRRLRRLPEAAMQLLDVAAVCGREFDAALVARAADQPLESVLAGFDHALDARIVSENPSRPGRYAFSNALVRQVLHSDMSRAKRAQLHARVGAAMEASMPGEHASAELAVHFGHALALVGADKALEYTTRAGQDALADFAFEDAAVHFERALALVEEHAPKDAARRVELLIDLATALVYVDERAGVEAARRAVERARADGSTTQFGRAVEVFVEPMYGAAAFPAETTQLLDEARTVLGDTNPALRARLLAYESFKYGVFQLRGRDGRALAEESVALARAAGDSLTTADALLSLAVNLEGTPHVAQRVAIGEELVALGRSAGGRASAFGLRVLAGAQLELAQGDELAATIAELARLGDDSRWLPAQVYAAQWRGTQALVEGRWDDVRARGADLRRFARAYRGAAGMNVVQAFHLAREVGDTAQVAPAVQIEDLAAADHYGRASIALAWLEAGDEAAARHSLRLLVDDHLSGAGSDRPRGPALGVLAEVAASTDAREPAAVLYDLLEPYEGRLLTVMLGLACIGSADRYLAMLSTVLERWDRAEQQFARAGVVERQVRGRALLPRTRYWQAWSLLGRDRAGDREAAHAVLDEVAAVTDQLGMHRLRAATSALRSR